MIKFCPLRYHLDEDEKKSLSELGPISEPTYNEGKVVYRLAAPLGAISGLGLYQLIFSSNKNDRLYQRTTYSHIYQPYGL